MLGAQGAGAHSRAAPAATRHLHPQQAPSWSRRRACAGCAAAGGQTNPPPTPPGQQSAPPPPPPTIPPALLAKQAVATAAAGAVLGPLCDGLHSSAGVLHYTSPVLLSLPGSTWLLETCWWVPLLFGVAGAVLGVAYPLLDARGLGAPLLPLHQHQPPTATTAAASSSSAAAAQSRTPPGWPTVLLVISLFVVQYHLSGQLSSGASSAAATSTSSGCSTGLPTTGLPTTDLVLALYAALVWCAFDASPTGLAMSLLTALCGPAVEVGLVALGLYHYTAPALLGVPTWIPWVYFCGGPAVGLLGRQVWADLSAAAAGRPHKYTKVI